jgi:DNA-binding beta-propeller fold protein YncE
VTSPRLSWLRAGLFAALCCLLLPRAAADARTVAGPVGDSPRHTNASAAMLPERYALDTTWQASAPPKGLNRPEGVDLGADGRLAVVERGPNRVSLWRPDGTLERRWGAKGTSPGQFDGPEDVALDTARDRVYVADTGNRRIQVFSTQGAYVATWSDVGVPRGVAVGPDGRVYVADAAGGRILVRAADGTAVATWARPGSAAGELDMPLGLAAAADGLVYVADSGNQRIQWFDGTGKAVGMLDLTSVRQPGGVPTDVALDGAGNLDVATDRGVLVFADRATFVETIPPLAEVVPEPVGIPDNREGVRRLTERAGVGLAFSASPALRFGDRVMVLPERATPMLVPSQMASTLPEAGQLYHPARVANWEDPFFAHVLDSTGLPRLLDSEGITTACTVDRKSVV